MERVNGLSGSLSNRLLMGWGRRSFEDAREQIASLQSSLHTHSKPLACVLAFCTHEVRASFAKRGYESRLTQLVVLLVYIITR